MSNNIKLRDIIQEVKEILKNKYSLPDIITKKILTERIDDIVRYEQNPINIIKSTQYKPKPVKSRIDLLPSKKQEELIKKTDMLLSFIDKVLTENKNMLENIPNDDENYPNMYEWYLFIKKSLTQSNTFNKQNVLTDKAIDTYMETYPKIKDSIELLLRSQKPKDIKQKLIENWTDTYIGILYSQLEPKKYEDMEQFINKKVKKDEYIILADFIYFIDNIADELFEYYGSNKEALQIIFDGLNDIVVNINSDAKISDKIDSYVMKRFNTKNKKIIYELLKDPKVKKKKINMK